MDAPNEVDRPRPVFLDETGRRRRAVRRTGTAVGAVFLVYIAALVASFARAPFVRQLSLPGGGSPVLGPSSHPPALGDNARTSPAPDLRLTVPPTTTTPTTAGGSGRGPSSSGATTPPLAGRTATTAASTPRTTAAPGASGTTTTVVAPVTTAPPATTTTTAHGGGRSGRTTTTNPRRP